MQVESSADPVKYEVEAMELSTLKSILDTKISNADSTVPVLSLLW